MPISRRNVLELGAGLIAFQDGTISKISGLMRQKPDPNDEAFWREIKAQFDLSPEWVPFNNAGLSPSPKVVLDALRAEYARAYRNPSMVVYRRQSREVESVRTRLAKLIGCDPDELALTPNATYGLHTGIMGVEIKTGRKIVLSDQEYARAVPAANQRFLRENTPWQEIEVPNKPSELTSKIPRDCGLGVFSTVTFLTGAILPIQEICKTVSSQGGLTLVDGAQSVGMLNDNVREMGCEMYTACLHKFLMAPHGSGIFYVNKKQIPNVWALHPAEPGSEDQIGKFEHYGTRQFSIYLAAQQALDFHELLGRENKLARLRVLREYLISGLQTIPKFVMNGKEGLTGTDLLLTVGIKGLNGAELSRQLLSKYGIHTSSVDRAEINGARLSPTIFTLKSDCDVVIAAIKKLAEA